MFDSLEKVIMPIIILSVMYMLYKKGIIKSMPLPTPFFAHWKGRRTLSARFWKFGDSRIFNYMLTKDQPLMFHYNVTVNKGNLRLEVRTNDGKLFEKIFTENDKGSLVIVPNTGLHSIVLIGENTTGKCRCEFELHNHDN